MNVHFVWQSELERVVAKFGCDWEGSFPFVSEFSRLSVSWVKVPIVE